METTGLLADSPYELIEGEVFDKTGQSPPHATALHVLAVALRAFWRAAGARSISSRTVRVRFRSFVAGARCGCRSRDLSAYQRKHPGPGDVFLIAEVSDSTFQFDSQRKARLYARAGFPEYVVLDLSRRELVVFRSPHEDAYTLIQVLRAGETWSPLHAPEKSIAIGELLGE